MPARLLLLFVLGVVAGALITLQSIINAGLGKRAGDLGAVFVVTLVSIAALIPLLLLFPSTGHLRSLPGPSQWYLYLGGLLGIIIILAPILLVPRIGATATLTALVVGQLGLAVIIDQFGLLGAPRIALSPARLLGVLLLVLGTFFIVRK
jgi:transporter family-2 protein